MHSATAVVTPTGFECHASGSDGSMLLFAMTASTEALAGVALDRFQMVGDGEAIGFTLLGGDVAHEDAVRDVAARALRMPSTSRLGRTLV
jgi:hypothetical protein